MLTPYRTLYSILSILALLSTPLVGQSLDKARMLRDNGLIDDARRELISIVFSEPDSPEAAEALFLLGQIAMAQGEPKLAAVMWQQLRADFPDSRWAKEVPQEAGGEQPSMSSPGRQPSAAASRSSDMKTLSRVQDIGTDPRRTLYIATPSNTISIPVRTSMTSAEQSMESTLRQLSIQSEQDQGVHRVDYWIVEEKQESQGELLISSNGLVQSHHSSTVDQRLFATPEDPLFGPSFYFYPVLPEVPLGNGARWRVEEKMTMSQDLSISRTTSCSLDIRPGGVGQIECAMEIPSFPTEAGPDNSIREVVTYPVDVRGGVQLLTSRRSEVAISLTDADPLHITVSLSLPGEFNSPQPFEKEVPTPNDIPGSASGRSNGWSAPSASTVATDVPTYQDVWIAGERFIVGAVSEFQVWLSKTADGPIHASFINLSELPVTVGPTDILLVAKDDESQRALEILTADDYEERVRRRQAWAAALTGAAAAFANQPQPTTTYSTGTVAGQANHAGLVGATPFVANTWMIGSYRSATTTFPSHEDYADANARTQEQIGAMRRRHADRLAELDTALLRRHTLVPGEATAGLVYYNGRGRCLEASIEVLGTTFVFLLGC